jgi:hypothetical protein
MEMLGDGSGRKRMRDGATMTTPGFTAEMTLLVSHDIYRAGPRVTSTGGNLVRPASAIFGNFGAPWPPLGDIGISIGGALCSAACSLTGVGVAAACNALTKGKTPRLCRAAGAVAGGQCSRFCPS